MQVPAERPLAMAVFSSALEPLLSEVSVRPAVDALAGPRGPSSQQMLLTRPFSDATIELDPASLLASNASSTTDLAYNGPIATALTPLPPARELARTIPTPFQDIGARPLRSKIRTDVHTIRTRRDAMRYVPKVASKSRNTRGLKLPLNMPCRMSTVITSIDISLEVAPVSLPILGRPSSGPV